MDVKFKTENTEYSAPDLQRCLHQVNMFKHHIRLSTNTSQDDVKKGGYSDRYRHTTSYEAHQVLFWGDSWQTVT